MSVLTPPLRGAVAVPGWAKNELWRKAKAIPSLDLRFAENKSLVDATTGASLVTFTRASSGTFVGSNGLIQSASTDVPRFDHNPTTGESLGLLVEEARTNLSLYSEDFSNAYWVKTDCTITANETTAPDGTLTADLWTNTSTPGIVASSTITKDTTARTYTGSLWVKGNSTAFTVSIDNGGTTNRGRAIFNLSSGTFTSVSNDGNFTNTSGTITAYADGWYRLTITTTTSTGTTIRLRSFFSGSNLTVRIWGAQVEEGAFVTSYIPTTTATVTRSADVASDTTRGGNIRSLFAQFRSPASGTRPVVSLDDNTANERIEVLTSGTDPKLLVTDGGSAVADLNGGTVVANVTARAAAHFSTDDYAISINGGTSQLDAAGTLPTATRIRIGSNQAGGYLNGTIARITGWESALPLLPPVSE